ncbi:MAG: 5-formyltetrahydrofolate cyclo-ligase [Clostridiales bacterium]|nr:5-formyltetrahydrofolate cyclo-ligase [Clostridiales bacterium]
MKNNSMYTKIEIRNEIREKKRAMTQEEIEEKSKKIWENLRSTKEFMEAELLYMYVSYNQEIMTKPYIKECIFKGKKVAVPKIIDGSMEFFQIDDMNQLEKGYQGILEPIRGRLICGESGLMLMPGLAFDKSLHRCGYGGGFYDTYLQKYDKGNLIKFALAYKYQIFEKIPVEKHDKILDAIVTEDEVVRRMKMAHNS